LSVCEDIAGYFCNAPAGTAQSTSRDDETTLRPKGCFPKIYYVILLIKFTQCGYIEDVCRWQCQRQLEHHRLVVVNMFSGYRTLGFRLEIYEDL
jgi:hypothetical protein